MKVMKFGGTSVGSVDSILNVKKIVESQKEPVIVVVSALGGITDKLIRTSETAAAGNMAYEENFREIKLRHLDMIDHIIPGGEKKDALLGVVEKLFDELKDIYQGLYLIKDLSPKILAAIVSYGERISSQIVAALVNGAQWYDSRLFIKTEKKHAKNILDSELTNRLVKETFSQIPQVSLVPGFISTDKTTGEITNLGRGGSDYTAAIIAASLDADSLEIWTDVDGFMTADPRVISKAYVIDHLSFLEAMELCNFGAKVIYPPTIYPVFHKNIPIVIKNTFNSEAPGTWITNETKSPGQKLIKGISSINDTCLITVSGLGMVGVIGVNSRIFQALAKSGISVFLVAQASSEHNTSIAVRHCDADLAVKVLEEEFASDMAIGEITNIKAEKNLATVAIVGENMRHTPGIAGRLFNTLGRNGISVKACAQGASEINISFVIKNEYLRKALSVIHDSFFLSEVQVLNLFIVGVGNVGRYLIEQIRKQQSNLRENKALMLNIVGIANSRKCIFNREGIDVEHYKELLEQSEQKATPQVICDEILKMNIFNSVFVDCTANPDIAALYAVLLDNNVNVVAANKIAASSPYDNYFKLKEIARMRDVKFLFETNVGAGLPIINTINSLINSGDRILKIEAVISGTLNYIFNVLSNEIKLSQAILMAKQAGYSEPDPREDLSGKDVIRKLVILSREAGYRVECDDVIKHLFIPEELMKGSIDEFFENIQTIDARFEEDRRIAAEENKRFRFVARLEDGTVEVGLQKVDSTHPFYSLESSNNVILLTTERYKEYPMEIKGYGAGAEVTAAGVFADIISIANIR